MNFEHVLYYLASKQAVTIYIILAMSAYIENIFPPWPSDTMILAGAFLAGKGNLSYLQLYVVVTVGGLAGAMTLYYIGLKKGRSFFEKYDKYYYRVTFKVTLSKVNLKRKASVLETKLPRYCQIWLKNWIRRKYPTNKDGRDRSSNQNWG